MKRLKAKAKAPAPAKRRNARASAQHDVAPAVTGRPSQRDPELAAEICRLISEGKSLRAVCALPGMPGKSMVLDWLREDAAFSVQYARAREAQAEVFADEIVELADEAKGKSASVVQGYRLAVDARKWAASKLRPRKYGDRGEQGPIALRLPAETRTAAGISGAAEAILRAACAGELTTAEAQALASVLETRRRAIETEDLERRLAALEAKGAPA